ncbi:MAG: hypothetical protein AAF490_03770 [Chloroflexota bacterium]
METNTNRTWVIIRILLGFIFFWAAIDKIFGLGFATAPEEAWLAGVSPTFGYLNFATYGPFAGIMQSMAGNPVVDILLVGGQLLIGLSLILGVGVKIAGYSGALMMLLIYLSAFPGEFNPLIDEHIIYIVLLIGLAQAEAGKVLGLGKVWAETDIVQKYPILE